MNKLLNSWYDDLRKEIKENKVNYCDYSRRNFVDSGITKISFNKLVELSGVKVVLKENEHENRIRLKLKSKVKAWMPTLAHIKISQKGKKPELDRIGISLKTQKIRNNKRDLTVMLLHEIAHGLLHRKKYKNCCYRDEIEAQSISHLVCKYLGLEEKVSSSIINHIMIRSRKYHKKYKGKEKRIRKSKIIQTSKKIIECLEQNKIIYKEFFSKNT